LSNTEEEVVPAEGFEEEALLLPLLLTSAFE